MREDPLLDVVGLYQTKGQSKTSREAAFRDDLDTASLRYEVYKVLKKQRWKHDDGFTDQEIQELTGMNQNTERPRRVELVNMGWVRDSGRTRLTHSGRKAVVWEYVKASEVEDSPN